MRRKRIETVLCLPLGLAALQGARFGLKQAIFFFVERTDYADRMASLAAMLLLTAGLLWAAKARGVSLHVFPARFGWGYALASALALALLVMTPFITGERDGRAWSLLLYSAVVVPVYEELLFRGWIWGRLRAAFGKEWIAWLGSTVLFALWHLGYADALALRVGDGLARALFWKALTGLCFGVVLGTLRLKAKNAYATMLLHGAMNIFGR